MLWACLIAVGAACPGTAPVEGEGEPGCDIPDFDDGPVFKETLTFATGDGGVLRIVRRPGDGPTVGETFALDLLAFSLVRGAQSVCVVDAAALDYSYGHHNWDETATATANGTSFVLTMVYDVFNGVWTDLLDGDIPLSVTDCLSEGPSPANGCFQRQ